MAALLIAAFLAGRVSQRQQAVAGLSGPVRERIMLVAVGEHLEQSQMILVELMNSEPKGPVDISEEQLRAQDLIGENRLYRQAALKSGRHTRSRTCSMSWSAFCWISRTARRS